MSKSKSPLNSEPTLEGRFLGFTAKEGYKLKYLRLLTSTGECLVKIPKEQRLPLYRTLAPGVWVQVEGYWKGDGQRDAKFKAAQVTPLLPNQDLLLAGQSPSSTQAMSLASAVPPLPCAGKASIGPKETILVCQKSDCCKKGGAALMRALQTELDDRGLADQVTVKGTGCMKRCKAGPNVVMPDKSRYSGIQAKSVPVLLDRHFPTAEEQPLESVLDI